MPTIKVRTRDIKETIFQNRRKHKDAYRAALSEFKCQMAKAYDKAKQALLDSGEAKQSFHEIREPRSWEAEYTDALSMAEAHCCDTMDLSEQDFKQFMLDEWDWTDDFNHLTQAYLR